MNTADCLRYLAACFCVFRSFDAARLLRRCAMAWEGLCSSDEQELALERVRVIVARFALLPVEQSRSKVAKRNQDLWQKALRVMESP